MVEGTGKAGIGGTGWGGPLGEDGGDELNYLEDKFGKECLRLAGNCKSNMGFGALVVKGGRILGRGWNRLSTPSDRQRMRRVDYCVHAEQAAILDALLRHKSISGAQVYVMGLVLRGKAKGTLSIKQGRTFICKKCPHALRDFNLTVRVPLEEGWSELTPEEAFESARELCGKGYWSKFVEGKGE